MRAAVSVTQKPAKRFRIPQDVVLPPDLFAGGISAPERARARTPQNARGVVVDSAAIEEASGDIDRDRRLEALDARVGRMAEGEVVRRELQRHIQEQDTLLALVKLQVAKLGVSARDAASELRRERAARETMERELLRQSRRLDRLREALAEQRAAVNALRESLQPPSSDGQRRPEDNGGD